MFFLKSFRYVLDLNFFKYTQAKFNDCGYKHT